MSKIFMPELSDPERLRIMQENADSIEQTKYYRDLSHEEVEFKCKELVDNLIKISSLEDELNERKEFYKGRIKPLSASNRILQQEVKTKKAEITGTLYHMADHESGFMETYDHTGELIATRKLRPDEKRKVIPFAKASNE